MGKIIFFFIFLLVLFPIISSVEIQLKDSLDKGETLVAVISGNFLEQLQKDNIFFYREHVKLNLDYNLAKINGDYYLYANLGDREPNNYSLRIENAQYMQGTTVSEEDLIKNFIITENVADFSIDKGFIITDEPFNIKVQNLQDHKITIDINENKTSETIGFFGALFKGFQESDSSVELSSGEIKNLEFELGNQTSFRLVELSSTNTSYKISAYVIVKEISFEPDKNKSSENQTVSGNTSIQDEEDNEEIIVVSTKTCEEENGIICESGTKCSETPIQARDATCCLATCEDIKTSNTGKIIGWIILVVLLITGIWFFKKKSRRTKRKVNLLNIAKGKR